MDKDIREAIGIVTCGDCEYFNIKASLDTVTSTCKRLDHKKYKFADPWFKDYDCGRYNQLICREFRPNGIYKYLKANWTGFSDWASMISFSNYVPIVIDGNTKVRYYVTYDDFANGSHIKADGSLNWVKKCYYKTDRESSIGYRLVWEYNNKMESRVEEVNRILDLDCREEENRNEIQKILRGFKPFSKCQEWNDISQEKIEKLLMLLVRKYNMLIIWLVPEMNSNEESIIWRIHITSTKQQYNRKVIYGVTIYEVLAKAAIYMMSIREHVGVRIRRNNIE